MKFARFFTFLKAFALASILIFAAVPLHAQKAAPGKPGAPVEAKLDARKVVRGAGAAETFASIESVKPGEVIEYVATFRNASDKPVRNLEPTLPLPEHTELVPGSPRPAGVKAGLDANAFAPMPLKRKTVANGREAVENVPYREYRFLRWAPVDLAPGQSTTVIARVKVLE